MTEKTLVLDLLPDGSIETKDGSEVQKLAVDLGAEITQSCRLSNVEWEDHTGHYGTNTWPRTKGWVVRAIHNPDLAVRVNSTQHGTSPFILSARYQDVLAIFWTREEAIQFELMFFNEIMDDRRKAYKRNG